MPDVPLPNLSPEAAAVVATMRGAFEQKLRDLRNRVAAALAVNVALAAAALGLALRPPAGVPAAPDLRAQTVDIAREEAARALAAQSPLVQEALRSVQDRAATALEQVGALGEHVGGVRQRAADAERENAAAVQRAATLDERLRALEQQRAALQQQLDDLVGRSREHADGLERTSRALAVLRNSETGQLARHVQTLAQLIEEHGSLADVQTLAAAVRTGTFAQLDCRALTVRRADGSALAELRDDALVFRDRRGAVVCSLRAGDDDVAVSVGPDAAGPQCRIDASGIAVSLPRAGTGERVPAATLGIAGGGGTLALAGVKAGAEPDVLPPRVALDGRQLLFHDAGVAIVRVGREPDGTGAVRVLGPGTTPGQQRGALLAPAAIESWENETGARRSVIQTGDQLRIVFGDACLRRRSDGGVELATEQQLGGDWSAALATLRR